jgi:hypothetical protein
MKLTLTRIAVALFGVVLLSVGMTPAAAAPDAGGFGHHVAACAQLAGFDGNHNPGMHRGVTGWEPGHACIH